MSDPIKRSALWAGLVICATLASMSCHKPSDSAIGRNFEYEATANSSCCQIWECIAERVCKGKPSGNAVVASSFTKAGAEVKARQLLPVTYCTKVVIQPGPGPTNYPDPAPIRVTCSKGERLQHPPRSC